MQYRLAALDDLDNLAELHAQSWRDSYRGIFSDSYLDDEVWDERKTAWTKQLSAPKSNQRVVVATENGQMLGFISAFGDQSAKWGTFIDNLHVAKAAQGRGVGKQLMHLIARWANDCFEHQGIYLEVLEDNLSARNFYQRLGASHQQTNLWLPPGSDVQVNDLIYAWENHRMLLQSNGEVSSN